MTQEEKDYSKLLRAIVTLSCGYATLATHIPSMKEHCLEAMLKMANTAAPRLKLEIDDLFNYMRFVSGIDRP